MRLRISRGGALLLAILAIVLLPLLFVFRPTPHPASASPPTAAAGNPVVAAAPGRVDVEGGTRHLALQLDGVVSEVAPFDEGAVLPAGAVLLRLDDRQSYAEQQAAALDVQRLQLGVDLLQGQLRLAEQQLSRLQPLVAQQAEPADVLRQAEAQSRQLAGDLAQARIALEAGRLHQKMLAMQQAQHQLLAPEAGRVLRIDVHPGESVSRGTPVVWFAPAAPLIVHAELDERLLARVHVGMPAEVETEYGSGHVVQAQLARIAAHVGPARLPADGEAVTDDNRVVDCTLELRDADFLLGQRVIVRFLSGT
ncbi:efflux RND transporter periplasmic adaptor subunit [Solimonas terrae]|uniref:HlyD family efflux transporter periplasmic adaptor subunit n=1 Tax=Solimonas terrae TaxID=1396819 RepID=A0A6M2BVL6_9GAMM|nr:HlyD family efflux transporter periplasmic adaptor subunit [Solimonas terrae]NGY05997.1 HlyD family efflux transporter periplasmic adaptor subunit [Solimonas terrae]